MRKLLVLMIILVQTKAVHMIRSLSDVYLSLNQTALIDVSTVFSGLSLNFSAYNSEPATIENGISAQELFHFPSRAVTLGSVFVCPEGVCFILYSPEGIEIWSLAGPLKVVAAEEVEGVAPNFQLGKMYLVYWTTTALFTIAIDEQVPVRVREIEITSGAKVAVGFGSLAVATTVLQRTLISRYSMNPSNARLIQHFEIPGTVIAVSCQFSCYYLTPEELYYDRTLLRSLKPLLPVIGRPSGFGKRQAKETPNIVTEKGVLFNLPESRMAFIPHFQMVLDTFTKEDIEMLAVVADQRLFIGSIVYFPARWTGSVSALPVPFNQIDVINFEGISVQDINPAVFLIINTKKGLYGYRILRSAHTFLTVSYRPEPYSVDLCAFDYFNASDFACTRTRVFPAHTKEPHSLNLTCPVARQLQTCTFSFDQFLSSHIVLSVTIPPTDVDINVTVQRAIEARETVFEVDPREYSCSAVDNRGTLLVSLQGSSVAITRLGAQSISVIDSGEDVTFVDCVGMKSYIVLYGEMADFTGDIYLITNNHLHRTELRGFKVKPRLLNLWDLLIVQSNFHFFILDVATLSFEKITSSCEIISIATANSNILVLSEGKLALYLWSSSGYRYSRSVSISKSVLAIAFTFDILRTYDNEGLLDVYFFDDEEIILLSSNACPCDFRDLLTTTMGILLVCKDRMEFINDYISKNEIRIYQHFYQPTNSIPLRVTDDMTTRAIQCIAGLCTETEFFILGAADTLTVSLNATSEMFADGNNVSVQGDLLLRGSDSPTHSMRLALTLTNAGAVVAHNPEWTYRKVQLPCSTSLSIPLWEVFSGSAMSFDLRSELPQSDIRLTSACEMKHFIAYPCFQNAKMVVIHDLVVCYISSAFEIVQLSCEEERCSHGQKIIIEASDLRLSEIYSFHILFATDKYLAIEVIGHLQIDDTVNELMIRIATLNKTTRKVTVRYAERYSFFGDHLHVVQGSHYDVIQYGPLLHHFSITFPPNSDPSITHHVYPEFIGFHAKSVSSEVLDSGTVVYVLTSDGNLLTFSLTDKLHLIRSEPVPFSDGEIAELTFVHGRTVVVVAEFSLLRYSLPTMQPLPPVFLESVESFRVAPPRITLSDSQFALLALTVDQKKLFIIGLNAPEHSNLMCILPGKYPSFTDQFVAVQLREEIHFLHISQPTIDIDKCHQPIESINVKIKAWNKHCTGAEVEVIIERTESVSFLWTVVMICAVVLLAWACLYRRVHRVRIGGEVELRTLSARN